MANEVSLAGGIRVTAEHRYTAVVVGKDNVIQRSFQADSRSAVYSFLCFLTSCKLSGISKNLEVTAPPCLHL
jgi:hypothetical protein